MAVTYLAAFTGPNGANPVGPVVIDPSGNLFGTTASGGANGAGTIYEIAETAAGYATVPSTLASFATPGESQGNLFVDGTGNLLGTSSGGGAAGQGAIFELARTATGYADTPTILVSFSGLDGTGPSGGLAADGQGDLFGLTVGGGLYGGGTLYEIVRTPTGYATAPTVLVNFAPGAGMSGETDTQLVVDAAGNIFGTEPSGGNGGQGEVFELAKTAAGYAGTPSIVADFAASSMAHPTARLYADRSGDLFGMAQDGGDGYGAVYEVPRIDGAYAASPMVSGFGSLGPFSLLAVDPAGNAFIAGIATNGTGLLEFGPIYYAEELPQTTAAYPNLNAAHFDSLTVAPGGHLIGTSFTGAPGGSPTTPGDGYVVELACFAAGVRIRTGEGETPIGQLGVGDEVVLADGSRQRIVWTGRRRIDCRRHPRPQQVWPVRVRAGAFSDRQPLRDLWLSPDHAVFLDGVLIPVRHLVNGTTIAQVPVPSVTYFHVELPHHGILLAERMPCESYLDLGNRACFENGGHTVRLHPDFASRIWNERACARLILGGPELLRAQRRVRLQAELLGRSAMRARSAGG